MGLKEEVMELLRQGREDSLADLVAADRRAVRPLIGRLWDAEPAIRTRAAAALGRAAAAHPGLAVEVARRLFWSLNDESATNGVYGIPALGQIGRRAPDAFEPFVAPLVSLAWDDGLRLEILRALLAVAEAAPGMVAPHLDRLERHLDRHDTDETEAFRRLAKATEQGADDVE